MYFRFIRTSFEDVACRIQVSERYLSLFSKCFNTYDYEWANCEANKVVINGHIWAAVLGFLAVEQFDVRKKFAEHNITKPNLTDTNIFFTVNCPTAKNPRTMGSVEENKSNVTSWEKNVKYNFMGILGPD